MSKEIMDLTEVIVQDLTVQELEKRMEMSKITPKVLPCGRCDAEGCGSYCPQHQEYCPGKGACLCKGCFIRW